jgi:hypothetical protein
MIYGGEVLTFAENVEVAAQQVEPARSAVKLAWNQQCRFRFSHPDSVATESALSGSLF